MQLLRFREQQFGFTRRLQTAMGAREQFEARAALGMREHLAHGGLGHAQQLGGFRERAGAHDRVEDFDVT